MGGAPTIEWIRPGVGFTPAAAASFRRAEASWRAKTGRARIDCNSTYRDWATQLDMYNDWNAYVNGTGPYPGHSRAIHPDHSKHSQGLALDSDDWVLPGFIAHMAEHGWIRTAANDPTERHHFEYQWWRDQHYGEPMPADAGASPFTPNTAEAEMNVIKLVDSGGFRYAVTNGLLWQEGQLNDATQGAKWEKAFGPARVVDGPAWDEAKNIIALFSGVDITRAKAVVAGIPAGGAVDVDDLAGQLRDALGDEHAERVADVLAERIRG